MPAPTASLPCSPAAVIGAVGLLWLAGCAEPQPPDPGRVVLRRLNRAEYDNTVRDLFGTSLRPARRFPADDFGLGFDNQAHALSLSPLHLELYDQAADELLDELFAVGDVPAGSWSFEAEGDEVHADNGATFDAVAWILWEPGALTATLWAPRAGDYRITIEAFGAQDGSGAIPMALEVDGVALAHFDVEAEDAPEPHEALIPLEPGRHTLSARLLDEPQQPVGPDRALIVDRIGVTGPLGIPRVPPPGADRVLICTPLPQEEAQCVRRIVEAFGPRAWRRPLATSERDALLRLYGDARAAGAGWTEGVRTVLKALLLSPHFTFLVEPEPIGGRGGPLSGHALASRLSYFIWSSTPDDRLLQLAASGALLDPDVLEAEALRMLGDPRSKALVENLGGQWLSIRRLSEASPDPELFPGFDEGLRASMHDELVAFSEDVLLGSGSILDLITSSETWVDARLAEHYGVPVPEGPGLHPVQIDGRVGWLGRAGLLTATSYPNRTSAARRGKWVLDNLLCDAPPPPPAGVADLEEAEPGPNSPTLRQQLERHRSDPACASCHLTMDAIGFGLEGFDGIGQARTTDSAGRPLDLTGELPGLGRFDGAEQLAALIATDPRFPRCVAEKTLTYALGRAPTEGDEALIDALQLGLTASDHRFSALVAQIVRSRPFRFQGAER
ncbi:MAG TPA: DUF1592 domain-containing protein [Deltaproteobacteria bacterium]|nr:DUF1592 domain-containing protein [Deltaproteobacteria bacterium]